ncbi:MAG: hypothetical protein ABI967_15675 [bacterium]
MNSRKMNMVAGFVLMIALVLAGTCLWQPALAATMQRETQTQEKSESNGNKLEGTWRVQVTIRDCTSGAALRTFPAFLTFAQGGTLTETTTGFPPASRTPGHGFWEHLGGHSYRAVSEAFLFNPAGLWTGRQRLTQIIEIGNHGEQLNSNATNEIFDTAGNMIVTGCATATGSYFE